VKLDHDVLCANVLCLCHLGVPGQVRGGFVSGPCQVRYIFVVCDFETLSPGSGAGPGLKAKRAGDRWAS
jgi:hypothetical protein